MLKYCFDQVFRRYIPNHKVRSVLSFCHNQACGGHFRGKKAATKILQCDFYWPNLFQNAFEYCKSCSRCQQLGRISKRDMMPLIPIITVEIFYVWGIGFIGPLPSSFGNEYTLLVVDYVSKWVEAIPTRTNDAKMVVKFLSKNILLDLTCHGLSLMIRVPTLIGHLMLY